MKMRHWAPCCAALALGLLPGCRQSEVSGGYRVRGHIHLGYDDAVIPYDAWFTWENYDPTRPGDEEKAVYIWQGEVIGSGRAGFLGILGRMSEMPAESRILVYPDYHAQFGALSHPSGPTYWLPFQRHLGLLDTVLEGRRLYAIFSPFDHKGKVHDVHKAKWHFRFAGAEEKDYKARLTWRDYDGRGPPDTAVYVWNDATLGRGRAGFAKVLREMEKMPPRSRILVYPYYWPEDRLSTEGESRKSVPFAADSALLEELRSVVYARELVILRSARGPAQARN